MPLLARRTLRALAATPAVGAAAPGAAVVSIGGSSRTLEPMILTILAKLAAAAAEAMLDDMTREQLGATDSTVAGGNVAMWQVTVGLTRFAAQRLLISMMDD